MCERIEAGLTETAGFCLTKLSSNELIVLSSLSEKDVASECKARMALRIVWHNKEDVITFPVIRVARPDQQMTKRGMLSVFMKIFDPLGYLSPFLIKAKVCYKYCGVKELIGIPPPTEYAERLARSDSRNSVDIRNKATQLEMIASKDVDLHGCGDASEMEYGSMVYLRITTVLSETVTDLVMSKTRIAPVKRVTLPRLELMAALITARLLSFVKTSLEMKFGRVVYWTDSPITLRWIQRDSYSCVQSILELTDAQWWIYCPTTDYPAGVLTRGCRLKNLLELPIDRSPEFQAEVRKSVRELHVQTKTEAVLDAQKYSSLTKLFNVTAYVFRFITNFKVTPEERKTTPLDVREIDQAEQFWLKFWLVENSSRLWPLNPYIDDNGILRVSGRLRHSDLPFHTKYPFLLSNQHTLVKLSPSDAVLSAPEILDYESIVKRVIKESVTCRKENANPFLPKMSDLPRESVVEVSPFVNTGLDLAGPLYAREGNSVRKVYICLFTCMTTRAVYLEFVSSLTAQRFLQAFDRFFAGRSKPRIIQCDNFTSFKEVGQNLNELVRETHSTLTLKRIEWKYITPWCGGYWERLVRSVKTALRKVLGRTSLDEEELATVLCGIEAQVNARPLTFVGDDISYLNPLTPSHFLIGRASADARGGPNPTDIVGSQTKGWRYRKKLITHFWKRWRSDIEPNVGNIVLIAEDNVNKGRWMMGRVIELFYGRAGIVRSVRLKVANGEMIRPTKKLRLLEPAVIDGVPPLSGEDITDSNRI
ncbi:hypothetical protein T07_4968 [Trichinella nelsoni]|uniref:Integrase catalytic domain-containing protein n=1 Tax=Trichinella nelsoni TaxID=6336 RepID=A0A0V0RID0_9BILA|nr:hypothetical protein T07_4968 [Trichinella nelsoni]